MSRFELGGGVYYLVLERYEGDVKNDVRNIAGRRKELRKSTSAARRYPSYQNLRGTALTASSTTLTPPLYPVMMGFVRIR